jgi:cell wall-associated NlpC family hydrolase
MKNKALTNLPAGLALAGMMLAAMPAYAITTKQAGTIMSTASGLIGTPYSYGGKNPLKGGIDCSGLTKWCYGKAGISIADGSANQYKACTKCVSTKTKAALLFFATDPAKPGAVSHVTLNIGDSSYSIGANGTGNKGKVEKFKFTSSYWSSKLLTCAISPKW